MSPERGAVATRPRTALTRPRRTALTRPRGAATAAVRLLGCGLAAAVALASSACATGSAGPSRPVGGAVPASPPPASTLLPGTQLTGAEAFEGPVRQTPVNGIKI
ncbi:MAG: hypothetical protein ACXV3F_04640, partial [Frankiaceae bacterium]